MSDLINLFTKNGKVISISASSIAVIEDLGGTNSIVVLKEKNLDGSAIIIPLNEAASVIRIKIDQIEKK